ncbi:hypothetical protein GJ744_007323 [Endocarpon pusillum]|uniref:Uncharacterized protein n=1 Tax=Endocarpon pusillum TaxID=364733 RepID=A0A8H7A6Y3_9EURO|nr:hypothetical protein GJ744_007323 [Endocarpon pusillum]
MRQRKYPRQLREDAASSPARTRTKTKSSALSDSLAQPSQPFHPSQPPQSPQARGRGRPKRKTMSLNTEKVSPGSGVNPTQPPASQPQILIDTSLVPLRAPQAHQSQIPPSTTALQLQPRDPRSALFQSRSPPRGSGSTPSDSRHSHRHSEPPPEHSEQSSRERGASSRERRSSPREPRALSRKRDADKRQEHPARGDKAQKILCRLPSSISQLPKASEDTPLPHANRAGAGHPSGAAGFFQPDTALGSAQLHRESGAFQPSGGLATIQSSGGRAAQDSGWVVTAQHTGALANVQPPQMFRFTQSVAAAQPERRSENALPGGWFGAAQNGRGAEAIQSHPGFEVFASPSEGLIHAQSGAARGIPPPRPSPGYPLPFRGGPGNIQSGRGFGDPQPPTGVPQTVQPRRGFGVSPTPPAAGVPRSESGTGGSPSRRASTAEESPSGGRSGANEVSGMSENILARTQLVAGPIPGLEPFQTAGEVSTSRPVTTTASPSPITTPGAATSQPATIWSFSIPKEYRRCLHPSVWH